MGTGWVPAPIPTVASICEEWPGSCRVTTRGGYRQDGPRVHHRAQRDRGVAMPQSIWPTVHAERAALAADLVPVPEDAWTTPSLCAGWSVHDVLGHMTATEKMTPPKFLIKMAGSGFRFDRMVA